VAKPASPIQDQEDQPRPIPSVLMIMAVPDHQCQARHQTQSMGHDHLEQDQEKADEKQDHHDPEHL
jgi:hypothetical protein